MGNLQGITNATAGFQHNRWKFSMKKKPTHTYLQTDNSRTRFFSVSLQNGMQTERTESKKSESEKKSAIRIFVLINNTS